MSEEIMLVFGEDGVAREYDDTWDITIHCESREEQDMAWKKLKGMEWIPCSERLPVVHEAGNSFSGIYMQSDPVLTYGICEHEEKAQFHVVTYCDDLDGNTYWSTELDALTITGVIAWMPLPEPYKEGGSDVKQ